MRQVAPAGPSMTTTPKASISARMASAAVQSLAWRAATLREARAHEDAALSAHVAALTDEQLAGAFHWTRTADGMVVTQPLWAALAHVFNHQTHHRGQVHGLLSQAGIDPPSLDLPVFQKASGLGFIE